ncbi:hypothetical protein ACQP1S_08930 [Micromonospora matsumotoense]|uniref:hypothetical protein n=1 Tax=Micromonospora matsumotoense TaxID=121616 RepID=UPI003D8DBDAF
MVSLFGVAGAVRWDDPQVCAEQRGCVPERPVGGHRVCWREWTPLTLLAGAVLVGAALWAPVDVARPTGPG